MSKFVPKTTQKAVSKHRLNHQIQAKQVRIVGSELVQPNIYRLDEAIKLAEQHELDLIEINQGDVSICRLADYQKFLYEQKKREKEQQIKQKKSNKDLKEIRFTANTDDNDVETKKKKIKEFIEKGHKVKALLVFKGRELQHKERGEMLLLKIAQDLEDLVKVENLPKLEGKNMHMMLAPKK